MSVTISVSKPLPALLFAAVALPVVAARGEVDFNEQIRPILNKNCTMCHGGVKQAGGVSFIYREQALGQGESGEPIIVPGKPEDSEMIRRLLTDDPDDRMPPPDEHPEALGEEDVALLKQWIAEGAQWDEHWAFARPEKSPLPEVANEDWATTEADHFILARLESEGLEPSPEAEPAEWLRRASFDLTGLPPTLGEWRDFQAGWEIDPDAAREAAVDRLLASKHFGERWAARWLDLARYSDTKGFEKDPHRDIWPYRDWLIRAFNEDLPLDDFIRKQLAGDLLPNATADDLIATAFHRNTMTNTEGGTDDEEFRVAAVIDRVNTTWTVLQGLTFGCVQCHAHPYDPMEAESYYKFMAFFNNTEDADLDNDYPVLKVHPDPAVTNRTLALDRETRALRGDLNEAGRAVAVDADWQPLGFDKLETGAGSLTAGSDQFVRASGTLPTRNTYTLEGPAVPFEALRVEIRPDSDDPASWPERGSVLSKLEVDVVAPDGTTSPVEFVEVFADHLAGPFDPMQALEDQFQGVGGYPKLFGPRWAVFVPKAPVTPAADSRLVVRLHQRASTTGSQAVPLRRFQLATTRDARFSELAGDPARAAQWQDYRTKEAELNKAPGQSLPVLVERPEEGRRETRQFVRGNWMEKGEAFAPGFPEVLPEFAAEDADRLDAADWFVSDENPLTGRVFANRFWAALFGAGLVETEEDFGSTGTPPSHPALLDHLGRRLQDDHQWHMKPFLKELVLSRTYRQDNTATPELREKDPRNRLLARGPSTRLTAEMVRDHALTTSGLLAEKQFGPPVMPPQPDGVWQSVYSGAQWKTAEGEDRYRRGLYTYWKRTSPYPSFLTFDAPARDICTPRRIATNTPLQALTTLNDLVYLECAQAFAQRMATEGGSRLAEQIAWGVRLSTHQEADQATVETLVSLHEDAMAAYEADPALTKLLADSPSAAALVLVANTILNLDASLTK